MKKKGVLHIITKLDLGGAQKSCLALIAELQKNAPDFEIYLISGTKGELVPEAKKLNHVFLLDNLIWEISPQNLLLEIRNFFQIFKIMRTLKIKHHGHLIVHTHTIKAGTIGRWCAFFAGIKIRIHTFHGFGFNIYQNKLIWLIFYLTELVNSLITSHFICVSSLDQKTGSEILPFFKTKSSLIRAATLYKNMHDQNILDNPAKTISSPFLTNLKTDQPTYKIGTIASLKTGKNLFDLLKAFKFACKQTCNLQLEIIGDGPLRPALEAYLNQHNLQTQVILLGWQTEPQIYTKNWQAFLFTSLWEGLPCAVIEMLEQQIPVLSYQVGGISDLISANQLYYSGKWPELARAMLNLKLARDHHLPSNKPNQPDHTFYIPKMTLDHILIYRKFLNHI